MYSEYALAVHCKKVLVQYYPNGFVKRLAVDLSFCYV